MTKITNGREGREALVEKAMPEVKKLTKKYGRTVIAACVNRLGEYEKGLSRLKTLKDEVASLEKKLN